MDNFLYQYIVKVDNDASYEGDTKVSGPFSEYFGPFDDETEAQRFIDDGLGVPESGEIIDLLSPP